MERRLLFEHIDVPGINTYEVYRSKGGYAYTIIDIDNSFDAQIKDDIATRIRSIEGVAAVRIFQ